MEGGGAHGPCFVVPSLGPRGLTGLGGGTRGSQKPSPGCPGPTAISVASGCGLTTQGYQPTGVPLQVCSQPQGAALRLGTWVPQTVLL